MTSNAKFKIGEKVVYPSHGVGEIVDIESQTVADMMFELYVISFPQDKMTLRVPVNKSSNSSLRPLCTKSEIEKVYSTLNEKPKRGNKMWSRREQEYRTKINSGQIDLIAEVVRDLYKNADSERSYSERTVYESALNRLASEIAELEGKTVEKITEELVELLKEKLAVA